jgi:release factor glutamine methyltransferase
MNINYWLKQSKIDHLDAELLLEFVTKKPREWILAHGDFELTDAHIKHLEQLLTRRLNREPIAYILGKKEFYGREFIVTSDVLIPRPETESLIDIAKKAFHDVSAEAFQTVTTVETRQRCLVCDDRLNSCRTSRGRHGKPDYTEKTVSSKPAKPDILDIGTGSGAIAITLALELPNTQIFASDISEKALGIARRNAEQLNAAVKFLKSDLLQNISDKKFDIIVANLPYVARDWQTSPETMHEPAIALFAADHGLKLIKKVIQTAPPHLKPYGYLVLELDTRQIAAARTFAAKHGFTTVVKQPFALVLRLT